MFFAIKRNEVQRQSEKSPEVNLILQIKMFHLVQEKQLRAEEEEGEGKEDDNGRSGGSSLEGWQRISLASDFSTTLKARKQVGMII